MKTMTPRPPVRRQITPLDPQSEKGRDVAARLSRVLAEIEDEIATRPGQARKAKRGAT